MPTEIDRTARDETRCGQENGHGFTSTRTVTLTGLATLAALAMSACSGSGNEPITTAESCSALAGTAITAAQIGLPTTGARVESATLVAASGRQPEFCRLIGRIAPVDPAAPSFQFTVGLPSTWNSKALHFGGGGYNGTLVAADMQPTMTDLTLASPLMRGFATFASDGGHQSPNGTFALNTEAFATTPVTS